MTFEEAQNFVLRWEGGLCDDPHDSGGITKYGVCLRFLKDIEPDADADRIRNLTKEEASEIFRREFWEKGHCAELPSPLDFVMYDTEVNCGKIQAMKFLQRALRVEPDGKYGKLTTKAVELCNVRAVAQDVLLQRSKFYDHLAGKRPSQIVFLRGWLNRVKACKCYAGL